MATALALLTLCCPLGHSLVATRSSSFGIFVSVSASASSHTLFSAAPLLGSLSLELFLWGSCNFFNF